MLILSYLTLQIRVSFQEDTDFVLTRMVAIDPDNANNGTVSYRIIRGNRQGIFKLSENSGDLYIGKKMVAEQVVSFTNRIKSFKTSRLILFGFHYFK